MRKLVVLGIIATLGSFACKGGGGTPPPPAPGGTAAAGGAAEQPAGGGAAATAPAPRPAEGSAPNERVISTCPEGKKIEAGDTTSPGGVIYLAYKAALKGDTPEAFEEFYGLFLPEKNREETRRNIWARVLQFVGKYTASATDPSYVLCRSMSVGEGRIKVFVKCNDPKKSDPPIVLENQNGTWKIDVMTP